MSCYLFAVGANRGIEPLFPCKPNRLDQKRLFESWTLSCFSCQEDILPIYLLNSCQCFSTWWSANVESEATVLKLLPAAVQRNLKLDAFSQQKYSASAGLACKILKQRLCFSSPNLPGHLRIQETIRTRPFIPNGTRHLLLLCTPVIQFSVLALLFIFTHSWYLSSFQVSNWVSSLCQFAST